MWIFFLVNINGISRRSMGLAHGHVCCGWTVGSRDEILHVVTVQMDLGHSFNSHICKGHMYWKNRGTI